MLHSKLNLRNRKKSATQEEEHAKYGIKGPNTKQLKCKSKHFYIAKGGEHEHPPSKQREGDEKTLACQDRSQEDKVGRCI